ncbi:hypothetical protein AK812_SmicGene4226 [Symbiodinium microadriaticum]|uniref:START domain-containing protein n=1 Tax=Symbiodinium microadriaticum TaxID=2951 RepID=A0A1Q9EWZ7_SYMMI|nr:hypothetical protein AK812_SmicGene4226 [Symbiodinium microadriaticum]
MGCCCCCCASSAPRVLPEEKSEQSEADLFAELLKEELAPGNKHGWQIKSDWPKSYDKKQFMMRVSLRDHHETGNPNKLLRGDGKYKGVTPEDFLGFLLKPDLPGLKEWVDVETLPDGFIKYCRVKVFGDLLPSLEVRSAGDLFGTCWADCCVGLLSRLEEEKSEQSEADLFAELLKEELAPGNKHGWQIKSDWPKSYDKKQFMMRVSLRDHHETGNPNKLLRGDGKYKGVTPEDFLGFLLKPDLPGLKEWVDVETLPDGFIKYCRVKVFGDLLPSLEVRSAGDLFGTCWADCCVGLLSRLEGTCSRHSSTKPPGSSQRGVQIGHIGSVYLTCVVRMRSESNLSGRSQRSCSGDFLVSAIAPCLAARDHCWKYTIDRREDGSIFVCVRTTTHPKCPEKPGVIRAYYYNSSVFKMSDTEEGVMEMTEFIFQDLGGGLPPSLMNAALPKGTLEANKKEMKVLLEKKKGSE